MCDCAATRPEFWRQETRIARKEHKCLECGDPILKGTPYEYVVGKEYEGDFWEVKLCSQCNQDWSELHRIEIDADPNNMWDYCICYGELEERIIKAFEEGWLDKDHPLTKRWIPEDWLKEPSSEDEQEVPVGWANPLQMPLPI